MKVPRRLVSLFFIFILFISWCAESDVLALPAVQKSVLPNQLVILHSEDHSLPFVTFELLIDGGSRSDPPGEEGLAYLTSRGLLL